MKEVMLNVIKNGKEFKAKEVLNDDLGYSIMGEGPWFTNSQFGGHIFLDGDVSKMSILGEIDGERILYDEVNLSDYFGKSNNKEFLLYKDKDWYIKSLEESVKNKEELEKWFNENNVEGFIVEEDEYCDEGEVKIGFIFYKKDYDIYCSTYCNVEELIEKSDDFNNAKALKR